MRPSVSIIVPAYNAVETLPACLESLTSLAPSPTHEIIVVDNGSTDDTVEMIRAYPRVRLVEYGEVRGPSAARNAGSRIARGDILAFTDADCVVSPEWLIEGVNALLPGVPGVAGRIEGVTPRNSVQVWMNARGILDQKPALAHRFRPFIQTANAFFRREDFQRVGGFDESLSVGEDCDLSWRILGDSGAAFAYAPGALVHHDHRATPRALFRQSAKNAGAAAHLFSKWGDQLGQKSWKTSVWECLDLARSSILMLGAQVGLGNTPASEARLDVVHRAGRKWGMVSSAVRAGVWQW